MNSETGDAAKRAQTPGYKQRVVRATPNAHFFRRLRSFRRLSPCGAPPSGRISSKPYLWVVFGLNSHMTAESPPWLEKPDMRDRILTLWPPIKSRARLNCSASTGRASPSARAREGLV